MMFSSSLAVWSAIAAALLAVQALLLAAVPRLLLFLSSSDAHTLTPLERFLSHHFAILLAVLALTLLLNVLFLFDVFGNRKGASLLLQIPSPPSPVPPSTETPSTQPLLYPLTIGSTLSAFIAWNSDDVGTLASIFFFFSLTISLWGLWEIIFANAASFSKTTGADKHTSSFIFGNKAAASSVKRNMKTK